MKKKSNKDDLEELIDSRFAAHHRIQGNLHMLVNCKLKHYKVRAVSRDGNVVCIQNTL